MSRLLDRPVLFAALLLALAPARSLLARLPEGSADLKTTDANITRIATNILSKSHFVHHALDSELAGKLLESYLDALDGSRSLFLQADVAEFAAGRASLTRTMLATGDTSVAFAIYARYIERLEQQVAYVTKALRATTFEFTGHDVYSVERDHVPRPRDLPAAQELWNIQLRVEYLQETLADKPAGTIVDTLTRRQERHLRTMKALQHDEILEIYLDALAQLYDPHSDYLSHEQMENLSIAMRLSLFGIGAALNARGHTCKIAELIPGGPAARSGLLKPGDRIIAVAEAGKEPIDVVNMPLARAVELFRGPKGSTVTLTVLPMGAVNGSIPKTVSLVREEIELEDQEAKARIVDLPKGDDGALRLGIVDVPSFYANVAGGKNHPLRSVTADVATLLNKLRAEHVRGVVLDLRDNGGGSLKEAITLTGLFIRQGPVVQTRDGQGEIEIGADRDSAIAYDGPLIVLTSRFSASASELLAGALQDYGRAVIVGDSSTFGKGTVQDVLQLAPVMDEVGLAYTYDPGAIQVTVGMFYRPSGASTQLRGVASDLILPSATENRDVGEAALKDPLPWDVVPAVPFERLNRVRPYLKRLRENSLRRVTLQKEFACLAKSAGRHDRGLSSKSISLNELERRGELAQTKALLTKRDCLDHVTELAEVTYEVTLRNASSPGLPPPTSSRRSPATSGAEHSGPSAVEGATGDVILNESVRILADYVALLPAEFR